MAATISQLSCFAAVNGGVSLRRRLSLASPSLRCSNKFTVFMSLDGRGTDASGSDVKTTLRYDASELGVGKSHPDLVENAAGKLGVDELVQENGIIQPKRAAKIHDFCFGIPFGGLVLSGGLLGFVFSRNPATLTTGVLYGGALLALSIFSLKIWRQGKSSLPFILGQAVLSALLLWKNFQAYSLTKKVFPTGFYAVISAAMLCFYSYVLISGGNPPPKKLKPSPSVASW
ncbi:protein FATTY ACID EXPORT 1, chloroplastic [Corylus avellana]|uniref:protein FATTY ACID EXPORT 1, chloroplastic n=1 Tax=Corylus avellana TaxID=13451 RepID=UPI00286BD9A4|nr:protein FATTY ACID EXPORT 1, chloroplastic [Corylus avellana]